MIDIDVDWKKGLISSSNAFNCGTWIDKMVESQKVGTKNVEIICLLKSALTWLDELASKVNSHSKVFKLLIRCFYIRIGIFARRQRRLVIYKEWANLIQASFKRCSLHPGFDDTDANQDSKYNLNLKLVNHRGIYKEVCVRLPVGVVRLSIRSASTIACGQGTLGMKTYRHVEPQRHSVYNSTDASSGHCQGFVIPQYMYCLRRPD